MKLGPVTKPNKRNTASSKKSDGNVISVKYGVIVVFPIYGCSRSRIPDAWSVILTFSLKATFYLTKTKNS